MTRAYQGLPAVILFALGICSMSSAAVPPIKIVDPINVNPNTFGEAVAFASPTMVLVGALADPVGSSTDQGAVYVYKKTPGGAWTLSQTLTASDGGPYHFFGSSIAVSSNMAVIGAYGYATGGAEDIGKAYIFSYTGGSWVQTNTLSANDGQSFQEFGWSVAIAEKAVLVGAPQVFNVGPPSLDGPGAVYVFTSDGSGNWPQTQKLVGSNLEDGDDFGYSVAASGNLAFIGTPRPDSTTLSGSAFLYTASNGVWSQADEVFASNSALQNEFGHSVSMTASTAVIGAPAVTWNNHPLQGAAYVFTPSVGGWIQSQMLTASNGAAHDLFGFSVSLQNNTALIGAYERTVGSNPLQGTAYIYSRTNGVFGQAGSLIAPDGTANDLLGYAVSVFDNPQQDPNGPYYLVGAPGDKDTSKGYSGSVYIFGN